MVHFNASVLMHKEQLIKKNLFSYPVSWTTFLFMIYLKIIT
jgi:hypothetical protein